MERIIAWNTGRKYAEQGQRMAATQIDNVIYFADIDRGIEGKICCFTCNDRELRAMTMDYYDSCGYSHIYSPKEREIIRKLQETAKEA